MAVLGWPLEFSLFYRQMEEEEQYLSPIYGGCGAKIKPTILNGLEIGFFRMMQLGGEGYPSNFKVWADAFLKSG